MPTARARKKGLEDKMKQGSEIVHYLTQGPTSREAFLLGVSGNSAIHIRMIGGIIGFDPYSPSLIQIPI